MSAPYRDRMPLSLAPLNHHVRSIITKPIRTENERMRRFIVYSEEYGEVVPVLDYGQGPMEYTCDVWEGEARNRNEARRLAWAEWRRTGAKSININAGDGRHPLAGVKVEELQPCPEHAFDCPPEAHQTMRGDTE